METGALDYWPQVVHRWRIEQLLTPISVPISNPTEINISWTLDGHHKFGQFGPRPGNQSSASTGCSHRLLHKLGRPLPHTTFAYELSSVEIIPVSWKFSFSCPRESVFYQMRFFPTDSNSWGVKDADAIFHKIKNRILKSPTMKATDPRQSNNRTSCWFWCLNGLQIIQQTRVTVEYLGIWNKILFKITKVQCT